MTTHPRFGQMIGTLLSVAAVVLLGGPEFRAQEPKERVTFSGHTQGAGAVAFSPDGSILASADYETVRLWNATTGKPIATLEQDMFCLAETLADAGGACLARRKWGSLDCF